ncbi:hypothetical protein PGT21_023232 [Puccinia graminis f. sp. tritici]|uniref:Uncharacterized protein n=1 Tax=Puccinia graminis f. sp. tritici TaxID=56615 RepID=A0A5B0PY82_PUCGR|nr:hypothetical protein PGT21_023232 [Puccinia graminis f. sp. tritici]KAA1121041.1 hypothetical protein PGTUg99_028502 [Puccinia graminis f. sp. tritici]
MTFDHHLKDGKCMSELSRYGPWSLSEAIEQELIVSQLPQFRPSSISLLRLNQVSRFWNQGNAVEQPEGAISSRPVVWSVQLDS